MPAVIAPLTPDPRNKRRVERSVALLRRPAMAFWRLRHTKLTWSGVQQAQSMGPALVLANHSNILDPAMLVAAYSRPIHFLAADTAMEEPFEGRVSRFFGSIPKRKFALDMAAIRMIRQWAQLGSSIGLFPEGERSWNSQPLDFVPGIERLVRMVKLPIVTAKIINGGRVWPRWAPRARRGHVHIEFSAPRAFSRSDSDTTILNAIAEGLRIDPQRLHEYPVKGQDLAAGLENPLYMCPQCQEFEALIPQGDTITCQRCSTQWRVDTFSRLHGQDGVLDLHEAMNRAKAQIEEMRGRLVSGKGPQLSCAQVHLIERGSGQRCDHGRGTLELYPDSVRFNGERRLELSIAQIHTCSLDLRRKLLLRQEGQTFQAHIPTGSALLWAHMVQYFQRAGAAAS